MSMKKKTGKAAKVHFASTDSQIRKGDVAGDCAFLLLLLCILACAIFFAYDSARLTENVIMLTVVLLILTITYYTSAATGLVINIGLIFIYATGLIYLVLSENTNVAGNSYFFMIFSPCITAAVGIAFRRNSKLQAQNLELLRRVERTSFIDMNTGFRIKNSIGPDLEVHRALAERFHVRAVFLMWSYRYPDELKSILGENEFHRVTMKMSEKAKAAFRKGDVLYVISDESWAAILLCPSIDYHAVIDRIRQEFDMQYFAGEHAPRIDLKFGTALVDEKKENGEYPDAGDLITAAEESMEYDV